MFNSRSRIVAPRIVQHESSSAKWWVMLLLLACAATGWFAFDYGRLTAGFDAVEYDKQLQAMQQLIQKQEDELARLRLEAASIERGSQIDKTAVEVVRAELTRLQNDKAELEKEVELLNGLLSDKSVNAAIELERFEVARLEQKNRFNLSFRLVHITKVGGTVKGWAKIEVVGKLAEKDKTFSLGEIAIDGEDKLKLGFKNFQKLETVVELPEDFYPETVTISAETSNKNLQEFEETLDWQLSDA